MAEAAPKKLTGLQMPLDISPELAKIIGTKKGEQVSRPQVVKKLWAYLKEKNLQVYSNIYKYCLLFVTIVFSGCREQTVVRPGQADAADLRQ